MYVHRYMYLYVCFMYVNSCMYMINRTCMYMYTHIHVKLHVCMYEMYVMYVMYVYIHIDETLLLVMYSWQSRRVVESKEFTVQYLYP